MPKITDPKKREAAFKTYCRYRDMNLIAEENNVTVQTVYSWRKEDNWDVRLNDATDRFAGVFDVLKRADADLVIADKFSELRLLEYLELQAAQAIVVDGLRPKSWNEAIGTLKMVLDRKDKLFERVRLLNKEEEPTDEEVVEEKITPEQQKSIDAMFALVQQPASKDIVNESFEGVISSVEEENV